MTLQSDQNLGIQANDDLPYYIDALLPTSKPRWNAGSPLGTPVTIRYSFMQTKPASSQWQDWDDFQPFTEEQKEYTRQALELYSDISGITFVEDSVPQSGGQIQFGYIDIPNYGGWSTGVGSDTQNSYIWIDTNRSNLAPGTRGYYLLLHEIGHSLGLKHTFTGDSTLPTEEDSYQYSNMSYTEHPDMPDARPETPQLYDIAAIQHLYGTNNNTRSGNNFYSWATDATFIETIWDGGGTDTIIAANQTRNVEINLKPGSFSSIGSYDGSNAKNNLAIAYGDQNNIIENAIGGSGNDVIRGNNADNELYGSNGNDYIFGDLGGDTISGGDGDDSLYGGGGNDSILGGAGDDTLNGWYGDDTLRGESGNDTLNGSYGDDYLSGGSGNDSLLGGEGSDTLYGGNNNDYLFGDIGNDTLDGGYGSDSLYGGGGDDSVLG
ncbi:MAG: hypothetical protein F6J92_31865, partial [Symploca sp. SIO1A3]|nr:hypothetical protein [Symploca sp. SIO1A3]